MLGLAVGLAMDAFAVSIATGLMLPVLSFRHVFRIAFHFGLFQFLMPVIGWLAGTRVCAVLGDLDHWLAFALLAAIGGKMLWEARSESEAEPIGDPTRGWALITLSLATSLDALAVGLSMALLKVVVWTPSVLIGLVTAVLCVIGIHSGHRLGGRYRRYAQAGGGLVLVLIGLKIVITHSNIG